MLKKKGGGAYFFLLFRGDDKGDGERPMRGLELIM